MKTATYKEAIRRTVGNLYKGVASELKDRIFAPGDQDIVIPDAEKSALTDQVSQAVGAVNPKAAEAIVGKIKGAKTYSDLSSLESDWVKVSQALQKQQDLEQKAFGTSVGEMGRQTLPVAGSLVGMGGPKSLAGAGLGLATASKGAEKTGATLLGGLSKITGSQTAKKLIPMLTTMGAVGAANLPNDIPAPNSANINGATPAVATQPQGATPMNPVSGELSQMTGMMGMDPYLTSALAGPVGTLAPIAQKYNVAQNLLGSLGGAFQNAGGAQGGGQGLLTQLSGMLPFTAAHAYNQQVQAVASQLSALLGISPQAAMGLAPNFMQTPQVAEQRLSGMGGMLGNPSLLSGLQ